MNRSVQVLIALGATPIVGAVIFGVWLISSAPSDQLIWFNGSIGNAQMVAGIALFAIAAIGGAHILRGAVTKFIERIKGD